MKNTANKVFWTWNWTSGGYNSCLISEAPTLIEAIAFAAKMGTSPDPRRKTLVPNPSTFEQVTSKEMAAIDRSWAAAFD